MKVKRIEDNPVISFKPIKLEITIESLEELHQLWHRTNLSRNDLLQVAGERQLKQYPINSYYGSALWDQLNEILEELNK